MNVESQPTEQTLTEVLEKWLKLHGAKFIKTHGSPHLAGEPDLIGCWRGRCFAVEVKRYRQGKLSRLQQHTLKQWDKAGAIAGVVSGVAGLEGLLLKPRGYVEVRLWPHEVEALIALIDGTLPDLPPGEMRSALVKVLERLRTVEPGGR